MRILRYISVTFLLPVVLMILPACSPDNNMPSSTTSENMAETGSPLFTSSRISPNDRVPRITVEELHQKIQDNADILVIDTRSGVDELYANGHIPSAIPVSLSMFMEDWTPSVPLETEIVLYCT